jgi:RNA polymerase sigma-70 factor (ECF subfamily)
MPEHTQVNAEHRAEALIDRARRGEMDALAQLFREHAPAVHRVAFFLTASADDAEDVVQDVFIGLPEALRGLSDASSFPAWLRRVAARTALMRMRTEKRRRQSSVNDADTVAAPARSDADRMSIESAIALLPEELREVFVLKEMEGYAHAEIAGMLEITAGNSEVRLFRARQRLRAILGG